MLARFFIAFFTFVFLWALLEAKPEEKVREDWVFRGLEQGVGDLEEITQNLEKNTQKDLNRFVTEVLEKEVVASELSTMLVDYFLVKRLKPHETSLDEKLAQIHEMLVLLEMIKRKNDLRLVEKLSEKPQRLSKDDANRKSPPEASY